jgi:hypothetical protein
MPAKGWQSFTVEPTLPEWKGGCALVVDLGEHGRRVVGGMARVFEPQTERVQYPKQALEHLPPPILKRIGIRAIRLGVPYQYSGSHGYVQSMERLDQELRELHESHVTVLAEIGAGNAPQPLGRDRPHLSDEGVMMSTKTDMVWLPEHDEDYRKFVYEVTCKYGWPKGPITGFKVWNEPWEGLSISGWGADMIRYRTLYRIMGEAVFKSRRDAGVDVLVGGCDSSSNTFDKLFPDGSMEFLPYLDFCSVHYQGLGAPVLHPEWQLRGCYKGRVLIWDTESWVANTDDRVAGAIASFRAAGYDRAMGIGHFVVENGRHTKIHSEKGVVNGLTLSYARPMAASISALQHFIGERDFSEILFQNGLPWIFTFKGLDGNPEDGTVVVLGDLSVVQDERVGRELFRTVRSLDEARTKRELRARLAALAPGAAEERSTLLKGLSKPEPFTNASLTLPAAGGRFTLYDFYGNLVQAKDGEIVIPLNRQGYYLRADGQPGSFAALFEALRAARIDGLQPVEVVALDLLDRTENRPALRLRLTNVLNRPLEGKLTVELKGVQLESPPAVSLQPHETKHLNLAVVAGSSVHANTYPLQVSFDAGGDGFADLYDDLHVNLIHCRTISVDGNLDDWKGALPQTIETEEPGTRTLEEEAWLPFVTFKPGQAPGFAAGYLAYDDRYFYFAAKIADDSPHPGALRYETRNDDEFFYPPVCYQYDSEQTLRKVDNIQPGDPGNRSHLQHPQTDGRANGRWEKHPDCSSFAIDVDLPNNKTWQLALYVPPGGEWHPNGMPLVLTDRETGRHIAQAHLGGSLYNGVYAVFNVTGKVRFRFQTSWWYRARIGALFFDAAAPEAKPGFVKFDYDTSGNWKGVYGAAGYHIVGVDPKLPEKVAVTVPEVVVKNKFVWPAGVRRFSYRTFPALPDGCGYLDNVQIAFNAIPLGEDGWLSHLPGRPPKFTTYRCTDYQYALNTVAPEYGGGFEVWRLEVPGMVRKHFYPRQPKHPLEGSVRDALLKTVHNGGTRVTEAAIPWTEIPHVKALCDAGKPVKFSFRVNHNTGGGTMELAKGRSVSRLNNPAFHVDWVEHWANELEFRFEK